MLPTIDISLIGVILAIWAVLKTVWGFFCGALDWITQRALALVIGSKLWATAAFVAVAIVIIGALSSIWSLVLDLVGEYVIPQASLPSDVLSIIALYVDLAELQGLLSFALACWTSYYVIGGVLAGTRVAREIFTLLSRSWKT